MKFKSIYQLMIQIKSVYGGAAGVKEKKNTSTPFILGLQYEKVYPIIY
jgi:hypothetical protein